jgi:hypothetical protein
MRAVHDMMEPGGMLMVYEPTCLDGEDRDGFLDRYEAIARRVFTAFDRDQFDALNLP